MSTESKQPKHPDSFKITIERTFYKPVTNRQYEYVGSEEGEHDTNYKYGEWVETHEKDTETLLEQTTHELNLQSVIAAINNLANH